MIFRFFKTIKIKLMIAMLLMAILVIVIMSAALISTNRTLSLKHAEQTLMVLSDVFAVNSQSPLLFNDIIAAEETLAGLKAQPDITHACLLDKKGASFAHYPKNEQAEERMPHMAIESLWLSGEQYTVYDNGLHSYTPVMAGNEHIGTLHIRDNMGTVTEQLERFYRLVVITSIIAFFVSVALMIWIQDRFTQPLNKLVNVIKNIIEYKDYSQRADIRSGDEFSVLGDNFNNMLDVVEHRGQQLEASNADLHYQIEERKQTELTLHESQQLLTTIIDTAPIRIFWKDKDLTYLGCNQAFANDAGVKTQQDIIGKTDYQLAWTEQAELYQKGDREVIANGKAKLSFEEPQTTPEHGTIWLSTSKVPLRDFNGDIVGVLGIYEDITERKQIEDMLRLSSRVFSDTHEGIAITNAQQEIIDVNPAFSDITGYSRHEIIGQNPRILSSGKHSPEFYEEMWQTIHEAGVWQGEVWNRKKTGELYAELLTISTLVDEDGNVVNYLGVFTDITQAKKQQEEMSLMAHYDILTGLPNRALFSDRFNQAIAHSKRNKTQLAVCFLDLDNFKPINDNYGHDVGDKLLIEVANRIKAEVRDEDTVSRQGGDEFAILLNDIQSASQCERMLARLHRSLAQSYLIDGQRHNITASSGVTLYPTDKSDVDTLLRADQAMYQAKQSGRNRYHLFNAKHDQETILKHHRLAEIEQALINNQFTLYYQPKVNMVTGEVFGAEALIRWLHPEKGLIPPIDFLPLIDGTHLEIDLGNWVIDQALKQLERWNDQGVKLEISVNIASHHLQSEAFFERLEHDLARYPSVNAHLLQLEILESSALGDLDAINRTIVYCQTLLGVSVSLDDFGTGYSSLTHLRSLPANIVKIDQSFIRDMLDDPNDATIIDGVIGLANSFSREVIAEGVETTEHGLMLLIMGCQKAQGYGIAKPMPAEHFAEWLHNYEPNTEWLHYGIQHYSVKEKRLALFKLTTKHWQNYFVANVQSDPDRIVRWPIMDERSCHGSYWLKRMRQEQLFTETWLDQLEQAHDKVHHIAQTLWGKYDQKRLDEARAGLDEFQAASDALYRIWDTEMNGK